MVGKKRVLMVFGGTELGGTQAFILNLLRGLDLKRFQVDIAVSRVDKGDGIAEELRNMGCQIYTLPYFKVYNYRTFVRCWRLFMDEHHYDIVHGHSTNSAAIYLKIAKQKGCTTIAHSHSAGYRGNWVEQTIKKFFAKKVGKVADYWFACSDKAAERLFGREYKKYGRYYNIPNAINADNYLYDREKAKEIRRQLGVGNDEILCGHVGSFTHPKNHEFLLDIFAEVIKQNPKAKLVCCGTGELLSRIKERAVSMSIADKVVFTGVVKNINEYLMAMDVKVFPSLFEGLPIAVVEAQATGLPVVMSDVITNEVNITDLVHRHSLSDSAAEWAQTICLVRAIDRTSYQGVVAESRYNIKTCVQLVSSLYEEMADGRSW